MRENFYQLTLIFLLAAVAGLFGVFIYREVFPEYKVYQNRYLELEQLRADASGGKVPPFRGGVKQIVMLDADKGPAKIDRCTSCHVALDLEHFSPTRPARDINGQIIVDEQGHAQLEDNPDYVWGIVDQQIAQLRDPARQQMLADAGEHDRARIERKKADKLEKLKIGKVGHHEYDMTKVLAMHPLIGRETRPFEFHSIDDMGCTSCHNGNGRGLVTEKAHGPVFDGQYHAEAHGPTPQFTDIDAENDPSFSKVFNHKPGHELLFQTEPLFVGTLMEAKCTQCHAGASASLQETQQRLQRVEGLKQREMETVRQGLQDGIQAAQALVAVDELLSSKGLEQTRDILRSQLADPKLTADEQDAIEGQLSFLSGRKDTADARGEVRNEMVRLFGSGAVARDARAAAAGDPEQLETFLAERVNNEEATGVLFRSLRSLNAYSQAQQFLKVADERLASVATEPAIVRAVSTDVDRLTKGYQHGKKLFISQACYACHRIAGLSRGGIGPELTEIGLYYPWYIKESIVWPQGNLPSSTMPNYRLDHEEVEALMTFLLAQTGAKTRVSSVEYNIEVKEWEVGRKLTWEEELSPALIDDVRNGMKVFATEGCAACHQLKGFESEVGFVAEKDGRSWDEVFEERRWFRKLFPQFVNGASLVAIIEANRDELERRLIHGVRSGTILEELEVEHPGMIESFYTNFKFARRAKDKLLKSSSAKNGGMSRVKAELASWKDLVDRVMMVYIQEYGLGRWIGPPVHWTGIYQPDWWLVEHFRNPAAHRPKSIMPVLPFDDTKFYALTHMLNVMADKNRKEIREIWERRGFNPELAFEMMCSSCHGNFAQGDGPTADWIYPIPKNLRNATFLRNLTKERAVLAIMRGVRGTPMPPWGRVYDKSDISAGEAVITQREAEELVDWLYLALPGERVIRDEKAVPKWQYGPDDVIKELRQEGEELEAEDTLSAMIPSIPHVYVSTKPVVYIDQPTDLFDVESGDDDTIESQRYYIKRKYYTEENLRAGEELFVYHCSVCHGKEGAGNGLRAETMDGAKPRMLTNYNWLKMRDDLRLLRSIKYGVPGTSMTPWGDYTSGLQRLQLVMFIRHLSEQRSLQGTLDVALFNSMEEVVRTIEGARTLLDENQRKVEEAYHEAQEQRVAAQAQGAQQAVSAYQRELQQAEQLQKFHEVDATLVAMIDMAQKEKKLYAAIGKGLIESGLDTSSVDELIVLLGKLQGRLTRNGNRLSWSLDPSVEDTVNLSADEIVGRVQSALDQVEADEIIALGKLPSPQRVETLAKLRERRVALQGLLNRVASSFEEAKRLRSRQQQLVQRYSQRLQQVG